jgi:hypothetical protein
VNVGQFRALLKIPDPVLELHGQMIHIYMVKPLLIVFISGPEKEE